jgi:hypothetical protein
VTGEVKATLDDLVARQLVIVRQGMDGRVYYKANVKSDGRMTKGLLIPERESRR